MADLLLTECINPLTARIFRFDDWTLNLQSGELEREGIRARLQEHPLQVLASLLESAGEVVTREQLIAKLWPNTVVDFDTGLNTAVGSCEQHWVTRRHPPVCRDGSTEGVSVYWDRALKIAAH